MKPKRSLDPELMPARRPRRWYRLPQSIAELMVLVAISGLGLAVVTEGSRRLNKGPVTKALFMPARRAVLLPPFLQPPDRSVISARPGIDDAMIKQAPLGIDDGMIFPRPGFPRAPGVLPPAPVEPSQPRSLQPLPSR